MKSMILFYAARVVNEAKISSNEIYCIFSGTWKPCHNKYHNLEQTSTCWHNLAEKEQGYQHNMLLFHVQCIKTWGWGVYDRGGGGGGGALNKSRGLRQITRHSQSDGPLGSSANKLVIWTTFWVEQKPMLVHNTFVQNYEPVQRHGNFAAICFR